MLRHKESFDEDNGVWVATNNELYDGLRKDFPSMRSIKLLGAKEAGWQNMPYDAIDFEESV